VGAAGESGANGAAGASATGGTGGTGAATMPREAGGEVVGHGCGCETGGATPTGGAFATFLVAAAFARRRRAAKPH
jgi:MYXO-CTERM domain-containing protein